DPAGLDDQRRTSGGRRAVDRAGDARAAPGGGPGVRHHGRPGGDRDRRRPLRRRLPRHGPHRPPAGGRASAPMTGAATGAGVGLLAGCGMALAVGRLPVLHRPRLEDRLAPYLRDTHRPSRLLTRDRAVTPFPTLERILAPFVSDAADVIERVLGGSVSVRRRL